MTGPGGRTPVPPRPPGEWERAAGAALAVAGYLFIVVATLTPLPTAAYVVPRVCIVCGEHGGVDVTNNVILFVPFAAGLALTGLRPLLVLAICFALTCSVELLQVSVVAGRDASVGDVLMNTAGGALGAALAATWRRWLLPTAGAAVRLTAGATATWLVLLAASGWALQRTAPAGEYEGQIVPQVDGYSLYRGYVLRATAEGRPIPRGPAPADPAITRALLGDGLDVSATVTTGSAPQRLAPVAILWNPGSGTAEGGELFALGQRKRDLVFRVRMHTADALVRTPAAVIVDAFPFVSPWLNQQRTPPDTMVVAGGVRARALYATATLRGRTAHREVPLTVTLGWTFFLPFEYTFGPELPFLTALWVGGLLVPAGYWAARTLPRNASSARRVVGSGSRDAARPNARRGPTVGALIAGILALGLGVLPALWHLHASRWWEWAAAVAGLAIGGVAGKWSAKRVPAP